MTRDELRADILEITTSVVRQSERRLTRMINEDLEATNSRIDSLDRRMKRGFAKVDVRFEQVERQGAETLALLKGHVMDRRAHGA